MIISLREILFNKNCQIFLYKIILIIIIIIMKEFCSKCAYNLNIQKSTTINDNRINLSNVSEAFDIFNSDKNMILYKVSFGKSDIIKNKKYLKLSESEKNKFNILFENNINSGAEFKCDNCNSIFPIKQSILLYELDIKNDYVKIRTLEENELLSKDPLLPHTHDYICKNPECITHNDASLKDAVFFKDINSYKINYICTVCYH